MLNFMEKQMQPVFKKKKKTNFERMMYVTDLVTSRARAKMESSNETPESKQFDQNQARLFF